VSPWGTLRTLGGVSEDSCGGASVPRCAGEGLEDDRVGAGAGAGTGVAWTGAGDVAGASAGSGALSGGLDTTLGGAGTY